MGSKIYCPRQQFENEIMKAKTCTHMRIKMHVSDTIVSNYFYWDGNTLAMKTCISTDYG